MTATVTRKQLPSAEAAPVVVRPHDVSTQPTKSAPARGAGSPTAPAESHLPRYAFTALVTVLLSIGLVLAYREEFTPEEGVGYWLGIVGGCTLLFLLAYPLRKRFRFMAQAGAAPAWFRLHMVLGILGPIIILYHSNFSLGATNSNVALFAMLAVAVSGIAGRYIYGKIHNGLYGARSNVHELLEEATPLIARIEADVGGADGSIAAKLSAYGGKALREQKSLASSLAMVMSLAIASLYFRSRVLGDIRSAIKRNAAMKGWSRREASEHYRLARAHVGDFIAAVTKASELSLYERLFSLWHIFHVPLFFLLIITGIAHVISVHLY